MTTRGPVPPGLPSSWACARFGGGSAGSAASAAAAGGAPRFLRRGAILRGAAGGRWRGPAAGVAGVLPRGEGRARAGPGQGVPLRESRSGRAASYLPRRADHVPGPRGAAQASATRGSRRGGKAELNAAPEPVGPGRAASPCRRSPLWDPVALRGAAVAGRTGPRYGAHTETPPAPPRAGAVVPPARAPAPPCSQRRRPSQSERGAFASPTPGGPRPAPPRQPTDTDTDTGTDTDRLLSAMRMSVNRGRGLSYRPARPPRTGAPPRWAGARPGPRQGPEAGAARARVTWRWVTVQGSSYFSFLVSPWGAPAAACTPGGSSGPSSRGFDCFLAFW